MRYLFDLTNIDEIKHNIHWCVRDPSKAKGTVWSMAAAYAHCFSYSYEYLTLFIEEININFGWYPDIKYYVPLPTPTIVEFLDILEFRKLELKRILEGTTSDEKHYVDRRYGDGWKHWHWPEEWGVDWNNHICGQDGIIEERLRDTLVDTETAIRVQKFIHEKSRCDFEQEEGIIIELLMFGDSSQALKTIRSKINDAKTLAICDPYIFNTLDRSIDDYIKRLISVMPIKTLEKLRIFYVAKKNNVAHAAEYELKKQLSKTNIEIKTKAIQHLHDRVWIVNSDTAFVVGTSFNSIGNKLAFMLDLPKPDLEAFMKHLPNS